MTKTTYKELLDAGVHFGHLKRKWDPNMAPYIFMERNGIHIIDLNKTVGKIEEAAAALKQIALSGRKILFVATKKQAKEIVSKLVEEINMPYVTERWPGGMLTNFHTIRKAVKKMGTIDRMSTDGTFDNISKKERLLITRQREKLEKNLKTIADLTRLPAALFIVDIKREHIAVAEAKRLNIPTFAIVDTNSDPNLIDFVIPANDDSTKSIALIVGIITHAVAEGLETRGKEKEKEAALAEKLAKSEDEEKEKAKGAAEEDKEVKEDADAETTPPSSQKLQDKQEEDKTAAETPAKGGPASGGKTASKQTKTAKKVPTKKTASTKARTAKAASTKKTTARPRLPGKTVSADSTEAQPSNTPAKKESKAPEETVEVE